MRLQKYFWVILRRKNGRKNLWSRLNPLECLLETGRWAQSKFVHIGFDLSLGTAFPHIMYISSLDRICFSCARFFTGSQQLFLSLRTNNKWSLIGQGFQAYCYLHSLWPNTDSTALWTHTNNPSTVVIVVSPPPCYPSTVVIVVSPENLLEISTFEEQAL